MTTQQKCWHPIYRSSVGAENCDWYVKGILKSDTDGNIVEIRKELEICPRCNEYIDHRVMTAEQVERMTAQTECDHEMGYVHFNMILMTIKKSTPLAKTLMLTKKHIHCPLCGAKLGKDNDNQPFPNWK